MGSARPVANKVARGPRLRLLERGKRVGEKLSEDVTAQSRKLWFSQSCNEQRYPCFIVTEKHALSPIRGNAISVPISQHTDFTSVALSIPSAVSPRVYEWRE